MAPVTGQSRRARPGSGETSSGMAPRRRAWGTISRDRVIDTATEMISTGGFERITIRSLAAELGVAPMSLYRHVRDKDDLLNEVVDRLLNSVWQPESDAVQWRAWITEAADNLRRFLTTQPAALHIYLSHPVVTPTAVERMRQMLRVLRQATGDEPRARQAYAAIQTYTLGFAALEASRATWEASHRATASESKPAEATDLMDELAAYTTPRQFSEGLTYLLDGIAGRRRHDVDRPAQSTSRSTAADSACR